MAVRWLVCLAVFSFLLSAERVADPRLLHEADSFLTRRHGARESEEKRTEAPLALGLQETSSDTRMDVKVGLPKCSNGSLQLDGVYEVKEEVVVEGTSCQVMGSATLLLSAPVHFQGSAVFAGNLSVKATGHEMNGSCVAVKDNLTLRPAALLSLHGCENQEWGTGNGGCLRVGGDANLLGGRLLLNACQTSNGRGGGIAVGGALQTGNATIDAEGCNAKNGGAIRANSMVISGGHVVIKESKADRGGAIFAANMVVSGGNVSIEESRARIDGGAIFATNMVVSGGNVSIEESTAVYGGAIYAWSDVNVSGGSVIIGKSKAYGQGGAIALRSEGRGGAIYTENVNVSGGSVSIQESEAEKNGGCEHQPGRREPQAAGDLLPWRFLASFQGASHLVECTLPVQALVHF